MAIEFEELQAKLAHIHLLKLRGEYQKAIEACRELLTLAPHSSEACCMMGDLYQEQQNLDEAKNWYELAVEYDPDQVGYFRKVGMVKEAIVQRDRLETARKIGLPTTSAKIPQFAVMLMSLIVCFGIVGFFVGRQGASPGSPIMSDPIEVQGTVSPKSEPISETLPTTSVQKDAELAQICASLDEIAGRFLGVWYDPRGAGVGLTLQANADDDLQTICAEAAGALLKAYPEANLIAVRTVDAKGTLLFVADMSRNSFVIHGASKEGLLPAKWPATENPGAISVPKTTTETPKSDPTVPVSPPPDPETSTPDPASTTTSN
jgi:tetratricopeptide (TPR) repeat protein